MAFPKLFWILNLAGCWHDRVLSLSYCFRFNLISLHARLNSPYEVWNYKKVKNKMIKITTELDARIRKWNQFSQLNNSTANWTFTKVLPVEKTEVGYISTMNQVLKRDSKRRTNSLTYLFLKFIESCQFFWIYIFINFINLSQIFCFITTNITLPKFHLSDWHAWVIFTELITISTVNLPESVFALTLIVEIPIVFLLCLYIYLVFNV